MTTMMKHVDSYQQICSMNWKRISTSKPEDKQICLASTMIQLSLFDDESNCIDSSIHLCAYNASKDCFYDVSTKRK